MKLSQSNAAAAASRLAARAIDEKDAPELLEKSAAAQKATAESFIASVSAARRPPPLPLNDIAPSLSGSGVGEIFKPELDGFSRKRSDDVAAAFANIFIGFSDAARAEGDRDLDAAFDLMGETMLNYEHLRLLRTGQLG